MRTAKRSLAERERGFARASASLGSIGWPRGTSNVGSASAGSPGNRREAGSPAARAEAEELLDDPVLERVERHHREAPAGLDEPLGGAKPAHEFAQFVVDRDAQRLEGACRGMGQLSAPRRRDAGDEPGKLQRRGERLCLAVGDDGARDPASGALLAEVKQNVGDRPLVLVAQDVGGRTAAAPHAHVEGSVEAEREAARRLVELHRRNPDVEHDSVHGVDAETLGDLVEIAEARLDKLEPPAGRSGERFASPNGGRVAIEGDHPRAAVKQRARIAAGAERAVDVKAAGARIERLHRLLKQDRNMAEPSGRGGAHHGTPGGASASRSARKRRTRSRA